MRTPKINLVLLIFVFILVSCKSDKKEQNTSESQKKNSVQFDDSKYVLDDIYERGDARRYGVTPKSAKETHPKSGKSKMSTLLDLAEKSSMEISFQPGYYGMNLTLDSRKNLKLRFNKSEFNLIHITRKHDSSPKPKNIVLKGTLIAYSRLGITEASDISIDSVILKTDISKNLWNLRNAGCHIYHGSKDIKINYLEVQDLGSGGEKYKYVHAALAIDGWNNNPENVQIKNVYIKSTDRHGIYITGKDHLIGNVIIDRFGIGSSDKMDGMQDSTPGEEKDFKALWINKCYDSFIENITINEKGSKGKYTAHFDRGDKKRPFVIGNFKVINDDPNITVLKEPNTNVIIEVNSQEQQ